MDMTKIKTNYLLLLMLLHDFIDLYENAMLTVRSEMLQFSRNN